MCNKIFLFIYLSMFVLKSPTNSLCCRDGNLMSFKGAHYVISVFTFLPRAGIPTSAYFVWHPNLSKLFHTSLAPFSQQNVARLIIK